MTATGEPTGSRPTAPVMDPPPASSERVAPLEAVQRVCPYLVAEDGGWRSVQPTRDHRCSATQPAAAPAPSKQRAMCLTRAHASCATFVAARELEAAEALPVAAAEDGLWPSTRATVLALEAARPGGSGVMSMARGRVGQALLVALMVVAFAVLLLARTSPGSDGGNNGGLASATGSPAPSATVAATPVPTATPAPATPTPAPVSPSPSAAPTPTQGPGTGGSGAPARTYKVKSGDTLSSIAIAYGITVKQLKKANDLTTTTIHRGQVLVIP